MQRTDPFAVYGYKYIKYISKHFEMVHYGLSRSIVDCEHVDINIKQKDIEGFNRIAGNEIKKRKSSGDIIACFHGSDNKIACEMNKDCKWLEPSIGYRTDSVFSPYRVFASYAQMHMFYGERRMLMNPSWHDEVIPNSFTISEFEYSDKKQDYFLYFGRVNNMKGVALAIQATEKLGKKLVIAGPGSLKDIGYNSTPKHVELFGEANVEQRKLLMKNAKCLLGLTHYVEPFGNMVIEANLSGTPVITTDWGGFADTVDHGKTGYRIRDFKSLLNSIESVESISSLDCRNWGLKFSDEHVHHRHYLYLNKIIKGDFYDLKN